MSIQRVRSMLLAASAVVLYSNHAGAHGATHAAVAVLASDEQGPSMVRLTHGLAYRSADGFRFVCPEVWGGQIAVPSSAIPDGPAVVAAEQLYLIEPSGQISRHPNHEGAGIALARNGDALFGLFRAGSRVALRHITRSASELLYTFDEPFSLLAVSESALSVLRISERALTLQQLSLTGEPRERVSWGEPSKIASAELRASGADLYVTLVHSAAPWLTLGHIKSGAYEQLRSANSAFAGPVTLADATLILRDGALELLEGSDALSEAGTFLECLDEFAGQAYACVGDGLTKVEAQGLAEPLFELTALREPEYTGLSDTQRADCSARWRDLRDHLVLEGRISAPPADAGEEPDADAGIRRSAASSCAVGETSHATGWLSALTALLLLTRRERYRASEL